MLNSWNWSLDIKGTGEHCLIKSRFREENVTCLKSHSLSEAGKL
jgi:hypothetical protein